MARKISATVGCPAPRCRRALALGVLTVILGTPITACAEAPAAELAASERQPANAPPDEAHPAVEMADTVQWKHWIEPQRLAPTLQVAATMSVLGLAPAVLLMTTSYIRITVVLAVLRQALGTQQLLPVQAATALALFCTGLIMWPTWTAVHEKAVVPWLQGSAPSAWPVVADAAVQPIREFMVRQIDAQQNADDIHLFLRRAGTAGPYPTTYEQVPLRVILPAFLLSELKTAFLIGFQIYLPFLVIDLMVAGVTTSMGMFLLPPATVALPLKLLLFVLVDGWRLVVEMLMQSFR